MIDTIKKYAFVLILSFSILIILILRLSSGKVFKPDSEKHSLSALAGENILSRSQILESPDDYSIIDLGYTELESQYSLTAELSVLPLDILNKDILDRVRNLKGKRVLVCQDIAISARSGVLLSQKGISDIFIMTDEAMPEEFKYKFRPITDKTASEPELD